MLAVMAGALTARADSLWSDQRGSLYEDLRAVHVGDIVTVMVDESATSTQQATTDLTRKSSFATGPGTGFLLKNIPGLGYSGGSTSNGAGTTARSSNLATTLTATVTSVLPSGNLVIQGSREVQTNQEKQKMTLTGVIRPFDIGPNNTIASTSIADAKIELTGDGPIGARQKEGIFTRIIRFLF